MHPRLLELQTLWMVVHEVQRQEAAGEDGMGRGAEPAPPCPGSGGSGCCWHCPRGWVMEQNRWQHQGCNMRLFPAPGMTAGAQVCFTIGTFASQLGKGRKKSTGVENSRCVHQSTKET